MFWGGSNLSVLGAPQGGGFPCIPVPAVAAGVLRGLVERLALLVRQHTAARDGRQEGYAKALRGSGV